MVKWPEYSKHSDYRDCHRHHAPPIHLRHTGAIIIFYYYFLLLLFIIIVYYAKAAKPYNTIKHSKNTVKSTEMYKNVIRPWHFGGGGEGVSYRENRERNRIDRN